MVVAEAVESPDEGHLASASGRSYDLADHPVPTGLEEIWRFTPLRRLKGLHDGSFTPGGHAGGEIEAPDEVTVELVDRDDPRVGSIYAPTDRVSAQAWASFDRARVIDLPAEPELTEPVFVTVTGGDGDAAVFGHLVVDVGANASATLVLHHLGHTVRGR